MTPAQEGKLMNRGCSAVFVCLIALGLLAYYGDRRTAVVAIALLLTWVVLCRVHSKRESKRLESAFDAAFKPFQGYRPELREADSYGYPSFTVCFRTKEEMNRAFECGHLKASREAVAELYNYGGFDIEKGFDETYRGWEEDFKEARKIDPTGNLWITEKLRLRSLHYTSHARS